MCLQAIAVTNPFGSPNRFGGEAATGARPLHGDGGTIGARAALSRYLFAFVDIVPR